MNETINNITSKNESLYLIIQLHLSATNNFSSGIRLSNRSNTTVNIIPKIICRKLWKVPCLRLYQYSRLVLQNNMNTRPLCNFVSV